MRYAGHFLRKAVIDALTGNVDIGNGVVNVYGEVPGDATYPMIVVKTAEGNETDFNKDVYNQDQTIVVEAVDKTEYRDKGYTDANKIMNEVSALIRVRPNSFIDLSSDNFNVYKMSVGQYENLKENYSDDTYFRTIATFEYSITDELN